MRASYLRVGLMIVVSVALAVALVLFLGRNRVTGGLGFESYFSESVQGLDVGSPVKFRGVSLGQVTDIALAAAVYREATNVAAAANRRVIVRFVIDPKRLGPTPNMTRAIEAGLRARLASQGITGLAYLELDFVDAARFPVPPVPWTPELPVIPSMPSTISQFQDAAQALAAKLQNVDIARLATSVQELVDDARRQISTGQLNSTLAEATALLQTIRIAVEQADVPGLAAELRGATAAVRQLAGGDQSRELLEATTKSASALSQAVTKLPALINSLETAVKRVNSGAADAQSELGPILRDARAAASSLRDTSEALRRYPGSVLSGPPPRNRR